ncbi:MAG TPA: YaiO family outer membrane beta-barrel protein [Burkholderiales bacterium]|nr:YaiO family outer membrane beta-barrel protein [Burkholderiales bacterium]
MSALRAALALLAALCPALALAQAGPDGLKLKMSEIELGASRETLSGGRPDWTSLSLEGAHKFAPRQTLYGGIRETERFDLRDREVWAGYYHPLGPDWTALVEGSASSPHNVLPKTSFFGQLSRALPEGWGVNLGWRHSEYTRVGVNILVAGAERYWGNFRGAYTLYAGRPEGATTGIAHRFALNYYYGDGSTIGISATAGREVDNVGPPTGVISTDVRNLTLTGRHWMTRDWALSWDVVAHEQGTLYRRQGFRLGLRYRF